MIHATCHTADNVVCLEFDATPWFSEAGAPSIIDLQARRRPGLDPDHAPLGRNRPANCRHTRKPQGAA
jgi:hypothetical protein